MRGYTSTSELFTMRHKCATDQTSHPAFSIDNNYHFAGLTCELRSSAKRTRQFESVETARSKENRNKNDYHSDSHLVIIVSRETLKASAFIRLLI